MEYFTTSLGFGFKVHPEMFQDWTHLTPDMIKEDLPDILSEYVEHHDGICWVDFGSNRKSPENIQYYIMAKDSVRCCDGLMPNPIDLPSREYEKFLRESIHKLNVKEKPGWVLGIYEW